MDSRGFYSSITLILRGGIPVSIGNFLDSLSQAILALVGIMLVGRLDVITLDPNPITFIKLVFLI